MHTMYHVYVHGAITPLYMYMYFQTRKEVNVSLIRFSCAYFHCAYKISKYTSVVQSILLTVIQIVAGC